MMDGPRIIRAPCGALPRSRLTANAWRWFGRPRAPGFYGYRPMWSSPVPVAIGVVGVQRQPGLKIRSVDRGDLPNPASNVGCWRSVRPCRRTKAITPEVRAEYVPDRVNWSATAVLRQIARGRTGRAPRQQRGMARCLVFNNIVGRGCVPQSARFAGVVAVIEDRTNALLSTNRHGRKA